MHAGAIISAIFHSGLLLFLVIGDAQRERVSEDEMTFADVSLISEQEFSALLGPVPSAEPEGIKAESGAAELPEVPDQPEEPPVPEPPQPVSEPLRPPDEPEPAEVRSEQPVEEAPAEPDPQPESRVAEDEVELVSGTPPAPAEPIDREEPEPPVPDEVPARPEELPTESEAPQPAEVKAVPASRPKRRRLPEPPPEPESEPEPEPAPEPPPEPEPESEPETEPEPEEVTQPDTAEDVRISDLVAQAIESGAAADSPARGAGAPLAANERDGLRRQIEKCWNVAALPDESLWFSVTISAELDRTGRPLPNSIKLTGADGGSPAAQQKAFEVARRAVQRCLGNGHRMPAEKYGSWRQLEITFNPEEMRIR